MFVFLMFAISYFTYMSWKTYNMDLRLDLSAIFAIQGFLFMISILMLCEFSFPNPNIPDSIIFYSYLQGPLLFFANIILSLTRVNKASKAI